MPKPKTTSTKKTASPRNNLLIIRGARVHNLKNVSVEIPKHKLVLFTGVSGSGKSSLAFNTIYAEGQRRFVESLSSYARQFLERLDKPDVDFIQGISPAVAIEQKTLTKNPRSTVGTQTEIYDYLRLLFARIGKVYCRNCGTIVQKESVQTAITRLNEISGDAEELKLYVLFPIQHTEGATPQQQLEKLNAQGFVRLFYNNEIFDTSDERVKEFIGEKKCYVLLDRIVYRKNVQDNRFADSLETAFRYGDGKIVIFLPEQSLELGFNKNFQCSTCDTIYQEPEPHLFSFNTPFGACPTCQGFGRTIGIDEALVIPNKTKTIDQGAVSCWNFPNWKSYLHDILKIASLINLRTNVPYYELTTREKELLWNGTKSVDGINQFFEYLKSKSYKLHYRVFLSRFRGYTICNVCRGSRLRADALAVKVDGKHIGEVVGMNLDDCYRFFNLLEYSSKTDEEISIRLADEIKKRLKYLVDVGLGYLTLDRLSQTLSGGESQRIHLSTALGSALVGALYVLDEPSIGLHPRDTQRLISILKSLRDLGNSVIVVEHDRETIEAADFIVDIGPYAGENGGNIIFTGSFEALAKNGKSLTGNYISGKLSIPIPKSRYKGNGKSIEIIGAREHNLKNIDVNIPLNCLVCITGVSGSGKSTLVRDILYAGLKKVKGEGEDNVGAFDEIHGSEHIEHVELVDQSPIGRSSRSNPVTYLKIFDLIRELFAGTQQAKVRGFAAGHFSFNVPGGRCEACDGEGVQRIEMQFLAELELQCDVCHGKRFKQETLQIRYAQKNIDEVLQMTVSDAIVFFNTQASGRKTAKRLQVLEDVGLGYLRLGQSATTLSGGEAQRMKLASYLANAETYNNCLFIFDEPTTGLHFEDIKTLFKCFERLRSSGHSLVIIEHNLDAIKCADWVIDLGPEAGEKGGEIVAEGTPEHIIKNPASHTGKFLAKTMNLG